MMSTRSLIKTFMVLTALLFIGLQSFAMAHAVEHDCEDDTQNAIACDVMQIASEPADLATPTVVPTRSAYALPAPTIALTSLKAADAFQSRAPPPRAPPAR